jgi:hypothetical protein
MNHDHDTRMAWLKMTVAWALTAIGGITLQQIATLLAIVYTALQIYLLVRDRLIQVRIARESARMELDSRPHHHSDRRN